MKSKDELCNELIKFSKQHLAFEFEDEFDDEFNEDDDLDYKEEYGLDDFQDDAYERGEE